MQFNLMRLLKKDNSCQNVILNPDLSSGQAYFRILYRGLEINSG